MITQKNLLAWVFYFCVLNLRSGYLMNTWLRDKKFETPNSWEGEAVPCYHDTIVFPRDFDAGLRIPFFLDIAGIILPRTGALVSPVNMDMSLRGSESELSVSRTSNTKCTRKDYLAKFKKPERTYWFDPVNWKLSSLTNHSEATPHMHRIPCIRSSVTIHDVGPHAIDLENVPILDVAQLRLFGVPTNADKFQKFVKTDIGQMFFKSATGTRITSTRKQNCACHGSYSDLYEKLVCQHQRPRCEFPKCFNPIQPIGHCCPVCGSIIKIEVNICNVRFILWLRRSLSIMINDQGLSKKISYFADFEEKNDKAFVQIVVLDEGDYQGLSIKFAESFKKKFQNTQNNTIVTIQSSGDTITYDGVSGSLLALLTLLGVSVFLGILYNHYISGKSIFYWIPSMGSFRSPFVFARFENHQVDVENVRNIVVNLAYEEEPPLDPSINQGQSFNNPMFHNKPVEEIGTELTATTSTTQMKEVELESEKPAE